MRRSLLAAGAAAAACATLVACGGDSGTPAASSSESAIAHPAVSTVPPVTSPSTTSPQATSRSAAPNVLPSVTSKRASAPSASRRAGPPAARQKPGAPVSGDGYVRPGTAADMQFTVGGAWQCVMSAEVVGCYGTIPVAADTVLLPVKPDSVQVTAAGSSTFEPDGAKAFGSRDAKKRPAAGKDLPAGRSIMNGVFVCAALPDTGVQCETKSGADGFIIYPKRSWLW